MTHIMLRVEYFYHENDHTLQDQKFHSFYLKDAIKLAKKMSKAAPGDVAGRSSYLILDLVDESGSSSVGEVVYHSGSIVSKHTLLTRGEMQKYGLRDKFFNNFVYDGD